MPSIRKHRSKAGAGAPEHYEYRYVYHPVKSQGRSCPRSHGSKRSSHIRSWTACRGGFQDYGGNLGISQLNKWMTAKCPLRSSPTRRIHIVFDLNSRGRPSFIDLAYTNISDVILILFCPVKVMATSWVGQLV